VRFVLLGQEPRERDARVQDEPHRPRRRRDFSSSRSTLAPFFGGGM
jgi:hypothetical protein